MAIALVTFPSSGQEQTTLADLGAVPEVMITSNPRFADELKTNSPITDDGHSGDELEPADQLMISFSDTEADRLSVDILDEKGRCVQQHIFTSRQGKNTLPVYVTGLGRGRYAVRVQYAGNVHVSHFQRD